MNTVELHLNEKQKLIALLYISGRMSAAQLLHELDGCEEMSLLRLVEWNAD